jgi:hypothetical protein
MKITTVLAALGASSLFATGAFAQTMQPIPNPPETEHPAHHAKMHHHAHHAHHAKSSDAAGAAKSDQHPK